MRTSLSIAAAFAVGAAVAGAGATLPFLGSDTLFNVTTQAIVNAGTSTLVYKGTGSGNGETAMIKTVLGTPVANGPQEIAPMSRFLSTGLCGANGVPVASQQTAEGIVVALDGISVVGSLANAGASTCNGTPATDCTAQAVGAAYNVTVQRPTKGAYTFANWRDVLAVVYGGKSHDSADTGCNSEIRNTIVNNWSNFFETQSTCAGSDANQGCSAAVQQAAGTPWSTHLDPTSGQLTGGLQHAFARDDGSGTADAFSALTGLSSPNGTNNNGFGSSPMCNAVTEVIGTTNPPAASKAAPGTVIHFCNASWNSCNLAASATAAVSIGLYPTIYQDNDPIRRPCIGTGSLSGNRASEQVCDRDGTTGVVLQVNASDFIPLAGGNAFPTGKCNGGAIFGEAPIIIRSSDGRTAFGRCPNGDQNFGGGSCGIPVDGTGGGGNNGSTACMTDNSFRSPFSVDASTPLNGVAPSAADGRIYNAHVFAGFGYTGLANNQYVREPNGRQVQGAFYRIHSARPAVIATSPYTPVTCQKTDATDQIGCLVQSSPCSIGFAGKEAITWGARTGNIASNDVALKINEIEPLVQCITDPADPTPHFIYPLARPLYLDSIVGFNHLTGLTDDPVGDQLKLAQYESKYASPPNSAGTLMDAVVTQFSFILIPSTVNGGQPFCDDFNEEMICNSAPTANVDACKSNPTGIPGDTNHRTCGDGVVQPYEDCDNGTAGDPNAISGGNGALPQTCSTICRFN
jgi:hypothetical protein